MSGLMYILAAAATLGAHNFSFKLASPYFSSAWLPVIFMPIIGLCFLPFALRAWGAGDVPTFSLKSLSVLAFVILSGIMFLFFYQQAFRENASAATVLAVVPVGAVVVSVLLAAVVLQEQITIQKIAGIILAITGIVLVLKG